MGLGFSFNRHNILFDIFRKFAENEVRRSFKDLRSPPDVHIETKNVVALFDIRNDVWEKTREFVMDYNRALDSLYVGLEDVRIMTHNGKIVYNANRGINLHHLMVERSRKFAKLSRTLFV
jgi:hypothetical protein